LCLLLGASALLWAIVAAGCLCLGSTQFGFPTNRELLRLRLEPTLLASLVGAALAAAGVVYQAILRNPLADPYLLGVSSGAALADYLWTFPAALMPPLLANLSQQSFAYIGALAALAIVFSLAHRSGRLEPVTLLLVGVIVNAIFGSLFLLIYHLNLRFDQSAVSGGPFRFLIGGLNTNLTEAQRWTAVAVVGPCFCLLLALSGPLNAATLSETEAQSLGVRIHRLRWTALIVASLMTAAAVAVSGPIGFIGLICPHLARLVVGNDQRRLLPVATGLGAALLAIADAISRQISPTTGTLPVGVLTGLLGGPFFLLLLWQTRRGSRPLPG
jgi:iron complex transport system permease protein